MAAVAASLSILSIIIAGTASGMIYGREVLFRQEVAKQVAYRLRGMMEAEQQRLDVLSYARSQSDLAATKHSTETIEWETTRGQAPAVEVEFTRLPVEQVNVPETLQYPDYYYLRMRAVWVEPSFAGADEISAGRVRTMTLFTAFVTTQQG
jgi:predicted metal-dependent phosphoesterase TrpH